MSNYSVKTIARTAVPRSKRLREGAAPEGGTTGSWSLTGGHTHSNKDALDLFRYDPARNVIYVGDEDNPINLAAYGEVSSGGPGEGGDTPSGALYSLVDVSGDLAGAYVKRADGTRAANGDSLVFNGTKWLASPITGGASAFNDLTGRPSYNGSPMTSSTDIPEVRTSYWNGKQDAISDLSTIRSQAANGQTAYGWGNHANAGYLTGITASMITTALGSTYVQNASHATSAGNADTVDSEHASAFAHRATYNNFIHSGNEFTYASAGYSGVIWHNYRTASGSADGNITDYHFGNGKGGLLVALSTLISQSSHGETAYNSLGNYLLLSGGTLTGLLRVKTGSGVEDATGNGLLVYHPTSWTAVTASQWGVGAVDCQGVIRSDNHDLVHYKGGTSYTIYDSSNLSKSTLGLGNVDNTADANKSVAYAGYAGYLATKYDGGQRTNPQQYFSYAVGLRVAMTGGISPNSYWHDTLWINGYSGGDVPYMCALHFDRNGTPRAYISSQSHSAASYGTPYEFYTQYNANNTSTPWSCSNLTASGNVVATGEVASGSDIRLKHSVAPVRNGIEAIMKLQPSEWEWNSDNHKGSGLIAQSVRSVLPHLVKTDEEGYLHLAYDGLHAYEISALQSHEDRILQLERENAELKRMIHINS